MTKLFKYKVLRQLRLLLPVACLSLALTTLWLVTGTMEQAVMQIICHVLLAASILTSTLPMFASLLMAWLDFYNTFFSSRAYLARTLPLSKGQLLTTTLLADFFCLALSMAWCTGILAFMIRAAVSAAEFGMILEHTSSFLPLFVGGSFLQLSAYALCGATGMLLGFRKYRQKLAWSLGFGILIYILGMLVMLPVIWPFTAEDIVTPAIINQLLTAIVLVYVAFDGLLIAADYGLVKGRLDVE